MPLRVMNGAPAGVLFAIVSLRDFAGQMITPMNRPLPFLAYPFLVLTFVGWGVWVMRREVSR